ncbi:MAG: ATP-binding cassette domain-containing protein [Flavobacteriaceae bacterium]
MISLNLHKKFETSDGSWSLHIESEIPKGSFVTLYGPSGAGKTTTLRMLAGLLKPDDGMLTVNDVTWFDAARKINVGPQKRKIGYVFQDYALFPHMSVRENLEYAHSDSSNTSIDDLLILMELDTLASRRPQTLSGGQQQRVALARALAQQPEILLLDEPLAALDYKFRLKLQDHLYKIHREFKLTTIMVSHDISEITRLSDLVMVMEEGRIIRQGTSDEIFVNQQISGKFKFVGEVQQIEKQGIIYIVSVLVQNQMIKVVAQPTEMQGIDVGDKVMIASKAFNPIIYKID